MNAPADDPQAQLRRSVYAVLIVVSTGVMLGRILAVDSVDMVGLENSRMKSIPPELERRRRQLEEQEVSPEWINRELNRVEAELWKRARLRRPFLSANDRSRWCTLRALVEKEMRVEGAPYAIDRVIQEPGWDTIDMVKHDGHLYSSKPPLFPTLAAIPYWLVYQATGATLGARPYVVGRFLLILLNVVPLAFSLWLVARLVERFGTTDWGRIFVMAGAAFGTFLTTFAVVLNNHVPAAVSATVAFYAAVRIWFDDERRPRYFVVAGLSAAFTAANELPALALFAALSGAFLWKAPRETLRAYAPAILVIVAGFFATNWVAHHSLRPPYMHRSETAPSDNWYQYTYERNGRQYASYWQDRVGIDRGEPSPIMYAVHALVGHHGVFSLTPVWVLTVAGLVLWLRKAKDRRLRELALMIAAVSLVCLLFYLTRPQDDRNYGGMTSGFRWMFWFAPLWLVAMLPAVDAVANRKWLRTGALVLLGLSVLSASYPTWNPWTHPWILDWLHYLRWIQV
ncbi:MAG: hypothetical protein ABIK89_26860 [Planctomycetota bacterium]